MIDEYERLRRRGKKTMERIYMDNAATTRVTQPVHGGHAPLFLRSLRQSLCRSTAFGREARKAVEKARNQVAAALDAKPEEIYFTGCGTESDNWALRGTAYARNKAKGRHIITTAIEHHAILHTCRAAGEGRL